MRVHFKTVQTFVCQGVLTPPLATSLVIQF